MIAEKSSSGFLDYLLHFLIGVSDGLIVPFALAMVMWSADAIPFQIFFYGTVFTCGSALIFSVVNFFSSRSLMSVSHHKDNPLLLKKMGFSETETAHILEESKQEDAAWQQMISLHQPKMLNDFERFLVAVLCGVGYFLAGVAILLPFHPFFDAVSPVNHSIAIALFGAFFCGGMKATITGVSFLKGGLRLLLLAAFSAIAAYFLAHLFVDGL